MQVLASLLMITEATGTKLCVFQRRKTSPSRLASQRHLRQNLKDTLDFKKRACNKNKEEIVMIHKE